MDIERLKAIERDTWNWIRAFGDQGAVTKKDFYALIIAIIAKPAAVMRDMTWALEHPMHDEPPPPDEVSAAPTEDELYRCLFAACDIITDGGGAPYWEREFRDILDRQEKAVTQPDRGVNPPNEVVEALRAWDECDHKGWWESRLAAAVRELSWALEHSANDCDTAEELERYIPICKTARAVEEMNG